MVWVVRKQGWVFVAKAARVFGEVLGPRFFNYHGKGAQPYARAKSKQTLNPKP